MQEDYVYVPLGPLPEATPAVTRLPSPSTFSSWAIALIPLALFAFDLWIATVLGGYITWRLVLLVGAIGIALTFVLALTDQWQLAKRGFTRRTSPVFALACPTAYLFVRGSRAFRESYAGFRPAWIQLASFVLIVIVVAFMLPLMVKLNDIYPV